MLELRNVSKTYKPKKGQPVQALKNVSVKFDEKGMVFILGKSGCGKSTLLNVIGGLDKFDSGEIIIKGKSSNEFSRSDFDSYRNTFIGFIFQEYNILSEFNIEKNIALALELQGKKATNKEVQELLDKVDLSGQGKRRTNELSGGQKQRVAIARALIKDPEIIIADEPTGALDSATGKQVFDTLKKLSKDKLVIIVSHDREYAEIYADRIVEMKDGVIISDETKRYIQPTAISTGFNLIGDDVIHIEKGQKLDDKGLAALGDYINSTGEEVFISLGEKTNKKLKEVSKISEDGKAERFTSTTQEDFSATKYDKKDLKLIKSRLKFRDSFKMGASALKSKVVRLVFTILLSLVAFGMFGLVDTMASFNRPQAVYSTIVQTNQKNISITKQLQGEYSNLFEPFTLSDKEELEKTYGLEMYPVYKKGINFGGSYLRNDKYVYVDNLNSSSSDYRTMPICGGFVESSDSMLDTLGFDLVAGHLPTAQNEICITKNVFDGIQANNKTTVTSYNSILETYNTCEIGGDDFTIVGIVDTKVDLSKYDNITTEQLRQNYSLQNKIIAERGVGFTSVVFAHSSLISQFSNEKITRSYTLSIDDSHRYSMSTGHVKNMEEYMTGAWQPDDAIEYLRSDIDKQKALAGENVLADNEILLNKYRVSSNLTDEELYQKIENKTLKVVVIDDKTETTYIVAGVIPDYNYGTAYIFSDNTCTKYQEYGFDYGIVQLSSNSSTNERFVKACETFNEDGYKFTVQNSTTSILDNFGNTISTLTTTFLYIGIGFAVFAALLLMNYISTSINYKKREIGILRALGARGSDVFGIFFNESFIVAFINFVLATVATFVAAFFINKVLINDLGIDLVILTVGIRQILLIALVSVAVAFIASLLPVAKISSKKPIDAIRSST